MNDDYKPSIRNIVEEPWQQYPGAGGAGDGSFSPDGLPHLHLPTYGLRGTAHSQGARTGLSRA